MKRKRLFLSPVSPLRLVGFRVLDARGSRDQWSGKRPPVAKVFPTIAALGKWESLCLINGPLQLCYMGPSRLG